MIAAFPGSREASGEKTDAGNQEPGLGANDALLEVLGKAAVASEPGEGAFDDPAFGFRLERADLLGSSDDLDRPFAELGDSAAELGSAVDPVGEDVLQLGEALPQRAEQRHCAVIVLDVGGVQQHGEWKARYQLLEYQHHQEERRSKAHGHTRKAARHSERF